MILRELPAGFRSYGSRILSYSGTLWVSSDDVAAARLPHRV